MLKKNLVVLSGAGISAESGIKTFRDSDGLWENHRVEDVASPQGFAKDPALVMEFYNLRRRELSFVKPNDAHHILAELEDYFEVHIITQNVDDLHERAGSTNIIHLHGELLKVRPINSEIEISDWKEDLKIGNLDKHGVQLRPHIVWFGEMVPEMDRAIAIVEEADLLLIIGTSMQVYPAAGLLNYAPSYCEIFVIDPHLENKYASADNFIKTEAVAGMKILKEILIGFSGNK